MNDWLLAYMLIGAYILGWAETAIWPATVWWQHIVLGLCRITVFALWPIFVIGGMLRRKG